MRRVWIVVWLSLFACTSVATASTPAARFPIPSAQEINENLHHWAEQRPDLLRIEQVGESQNGVPILLCHFTDERVADEDKQRVLLTASHTRELAAPSYLLFLGRWLLSGDPEAEEILRRQQILILPLISPDEYPGPARDVYGRWDFGGVQDAENRPEAATYQRVIDTYLPEVHVDLHSTANVLGSMLSASMNYRGAAGGWGRSFLAEVPLLMDRAADEAGMVMVYGDEGDGTITVTAPVPGANEHYYSRAGRVVPWVYTYHKSHALSMIMEAGFVERYLVSIKALLRKGNETWRLERYPGYAVNQIACELSVAVSAWGDTAEKRRASRVELWEKKANVNPALFHPETRGYVNAIVVTDPELRRRLMTNAEGEFEGYPFARDFMNNLRNESIADDYDIDAIWHAAGTVQPYRDPDTLRVFFNHFYTVNKDTDDPLIHNGMNIRVFIPYTNPKINAVLLDGVPCSPGETAGYVVYHNPGTIVEVSIPPGEVKPLHFVTVTYEPDEERLYGFTEEYWELEP